jgi:YVTN family beta-propeller protein
LRERPVSALMLGLYRAGRQTDALDAFQAARQRLIEELGLEPEPGLYELQRRILQHDPSLGGSPRFLARRGARGRGKLTVAAVLALGVVAGAVFVFGAGVVDRRPPLAPGVSGVVAVDTGSGQIAAATSLTGTPAALSTCGGSVWVADASDGTVSRIDPASGVSIDRITVGGDPTSIASGDGTVWVANTDGATALRINPTTETVTQTIPLGAGAPDALALGGGRLWVADSSTRTLHELDPATGERLRTIPLQVSPSAIAFGFGALWVAGYDTATVLKLDPASGQVVGRVHVGTGPDALAFAAGDIWVANSLDSTVSMIDPASLAFEATIPVGSGPTAVISDAGSVWVASRHSDSVSRINPRRNAVAATVAVDGMPTSLTSAGGRLWIGVEATGAGHGGGTLVIASVRPFRSIDPAFFNATEPPQFDGLAYHTLVTFEHTSGVDGLRLVPDLALALATPADGGRTYTFRLRPGIRYSNGTRLRASDFRRALERLFDAGSPGTDFYRGIAGTAACISHPSRCDLSRGVVTNDATRTIVFHLTAPDPEFLYKLTEQDYTAPVPPGTPEHDSGLKPIASTGPYRIARADNTGITFARKRYFREWSHAAQPDGDPDAIVWRYFPTLQAATMAVQKGQADWLNGLIPTSAYSQIELQSPAQLHTHPLFAVEFIPLNTHLAPFNSVTARKALNYAIDRSRIAALYGGPAFATPTCQPLAPALPGYRRYCPFTSRTSQNGAYSGPDLSYAKRLVKQSGTRGEHIDVWGSPDEGYIPPKEPAYVASVLRSLGYRTTLHLASFATLTNAIVSRTQMNANGDWITDYPDPSSYFPPFFSCNGGNNPGYICDPALDQEMQHAESLELTAPTIANELWTMVDHTLTNQADWVPTVTPRQVDLVSSRLGNYQFNPVWGFLIDQSWVRWTKPDDLQPG